MFEVSIISRRSQSTFAFTSKSVEYIDFPTLMFDGELIPRWSFGYCFTGAVIFSWIWSMDVSLLYRGTETFSRKECTGFEPNCHLSHNTAVYVKFVFKYDLISIVICIFVFVIFIHYSSSFSPSSHQFFWKMSKSTCIFGRYLWSVMYPISWISLRSFFKSSRLNNMILEEGGWRFWKTIFNLFAFRWHFDTTG